MQRINDYALYELAGRLKQLEKYSEGTKKDESWLDAVYARDAVGRLLAGNPVTVEFSRESARQLRNSIIEAFLTDKKGNEILPFDEGNEEKLNIWSVRQYKDKLGRFETVFATEMRAAATYFVPRRGIYHTPSLVDHADNSFPEDIRKFIPAKSKEDWQAAGRCLAFSLYSASGFHVTRAVEGTLENYYQLFCNQPSGKTLHGWHDYIDALSKVTASPKPLGKTLEEIKKMKDDYRNPIAHPRVILSEIDARMLFDNGESLIISMAAEIEASRPSPVDTPAAASASNV